MRLLLDTHAFIWWDSEPQMMSHRALALCKDPENELLLSLVQLDVLAEMNSFSIEGRYPDALSSPPSHEEALGYLNRAEEVFRWLIHL